MADRTLDALDDALDVANRDASLWFGRMARADREGDKDLASSFMKRRDSRTAVCIGLADLIAAYKESSE